MPQAITTILVRLRADQRRFGNDLERLSIATDKDDEHGDKILRPLSEVANVYPGTGPSSIRRRDLVREVRVSANTDGRPLQELSNDINAASARLNLPSGYDIVAGGDTEELEIMFRNMFQALFLAVIFIYLILASQFGIVHASAGDHAVAAALACRRGGDAVLHPRHAEHHEHDWPDHAHGTRDEKRDPARRFCQPGAPRRVAAAPGAAPCRDDAFAAHRHDHSP